jgi:hypothetical protein
MTHAAVPAPRDPLVPTDPIERQEKRVQKVLIGLVAVLTFLVALLVAGMVYLLIQVNALGELNKTAQCSFYSAIGGIPVPAKPVPTKRNIQIVASARIAFEHLGCDTPIDPPNKTLVKYAAKYHVPLR